MHDDSNDADGAETAQESKITFKVFFQILMSGLYIGETRILSLKKTLFLSQMIQYRRINQLVYEPVHKQVFTIRKERPGPEYPGRLQIQVT